MLKLFIGDENRPENLCFDNEVGFMDTQLIRDDIVDLILENVEKAEYESERTFKDRFGRSLYTQFLSTGTKTLLNGHLQPDKVFFGGELGLNALQLMFKLDTGSFWFRNKEMKFFSARPGVIVEVNGVLCYNPEEMEEAAYECLLKI